MTQRSGQMAQTPALKEAPVESPGAPVPSFRTFTLIWFGQLVSLIGSGLTSFALGVWVYQQTGSVTQFALLSVATSIPGIILLPFAGALVDRWDRRWTMMVSDSAAALGTLCLSLLLASSQLELWHIYVAMAVNASASAFQWPAYSAATTLLVPKQHLARAAGMVQTARATSQVLSPLLAGFLVVTIGIHGVLLVDFATFLFAVTFLSLVRIPRPREATGAGRHGSLLSDIKFAGRYLTERPGLIRLLTFFSSINLFYSLAVVLVTPLMLSFKTAEVLGFTVSAGATGLLLGGLLVSAWGGPKRRIHGVVGTALVLGVSLMVVGVRPQVPLIAAGLFCFNFCIPIINSCSQAIWQVKVAAHLQGRIFAIRRMLVTSSSPLGYLLAGPLVDKVFEPLLAPGGVLAGSVGLVVGTGAGRGIGLVFLVLGLMCCIIGAWGLMSTRLMRIEEELPDATQEVRA